VAPHCQIALPVSVTRLHSDYCCQNRAFPAQLGYYETSLFITVNKDHIASWATFELHLIGFWTGISTLTWQPDWPSRCSGGPARSRSLQPGWTGYGNPR